jgi:hypothetical protein
MHRELPESRAPASPALAEVIGEQLHCPEHAPCDSSRDANDGNPSAVTESRGKGAQKYPALFCSFQKSMS